MAFGDEVREKTKFRLAGNFLFKLIATIIALIIGAWATISKENKSANEFSDFQIKTENEARLRDSLNSENLRKRDSLHNEIDREHEEEYIKDLERNNGENLNTYTSTLAKYHLKYIASQDKIESLVRDSSMKEIPSFGIQHLTEAVSFKYNETNDTLIGNISYKNLGNCPVLVSMDLFIATQKGDVLTMMPFKLRVLQNSLYTIDEPINYPLSLIGFNGRHADIIWVLSKGNCVTTNGKKNSPIDALIEWNFKTSVWGVPIVASQEEKVRNFIQSSGIK